MTCALSWTAILAKSLLPAVRAPTYNPSMILVPTSVCTRRLIGDGPATLAHPEVGLCRPKTATGSRQQIRPNEHPHSARGLPRGRFGFAAGMVQSSEAMSARNAARMFWWSSRLRTECNGNACAWPGCIGRTAFLCAQVFTPVAPRKRDSESRSTSCTSRLCHPRSNQPEISSWPRASLVSFPPATAQLGCRGRRSD